MSNSYCQNCSWQGDDSELCEIKDLTERVSPGEPMPSGQCPRCGALCQPLTEQDEEHEYEFTISLSVTAKTFEEASNRAISDLQDSEMVWTDYTVRNTDTGFVWKEGSGASLAHVGFAKCWPPHISLSYECPSCGEEVDIREARTL